MTGASAGPGPGSDQRISPIGRADVDRVVELVYELAEYERLVEECRLTSDQLTAALFGDRPALFGLVARADADPAGEVVGYALYFLNYSTWEGTHGIYLEDLYVSPGHRGTGLGKALLGTLAGIAVREGYARVEWMVLDWNVPAIAFYESIGARGLTDWTTYRLTGPALAAGSVDVGAVGR